MSSKGITSYECVCCAGRGTVPLGLGSIGACPECHGDGNNYVHHIDGARVHAARELSPESSQAIQSVIRAAEKTMAEVAGDE